MIRSLITPYSQVLRSPGARRFSLSALIARLPLSMVGLGIVLLVSAREGSYGLAGILTASYVVASAFATPIGARYVDRWGQRSVVSIIIAIHVPSLLAFVAGVIMQWPVMVLIVLAATAGATQPASGSLVRARWVHAVGGTPNLRTAFAWESILDEVIFVVGPPLATILAIAVAPSAPLLTAALLVLTGSLLLISHRASEPPPRPPVVSDTPAWRRPALIWLTLIMIALGSVFGSLEIVTVAAARELGQPAAAGLILALYAGGSLLGGIVFGARESTTIPVLRQLLIGAGVVALVGVFFPLTTSIPLLSVLAVFAGLAIAPVLILTNQLVQAAVPPEQLTEGLAWVNTTGLGMGVALSAAAAGAIVDTAGFSVAYIVTASAGIATAAFAALFVKFGSGRLVQPVGDSPA